MPCSAASNPGSRWSHRTSEVENLQLQAGWFCAENDRVSAGGIA